MHMGLVCFSDKPFALRVQVRQTIDQRLFVVVAEENGLAALTDCR